jgi:hypothetical protein
VAQEDEGLVSRVGPIEVDWPRSLGFFGAVGVATVIGLIEPPLGVFIAAVPFVKMLNRPQLPTPTRFVSQILDGMVKPVGGDAEGTIRFAQPEHKSTSRRAAARHDGEASPGSGRANRGRAAPEGAAAAPRRATSRRRGPAR